MNKCLIICPTIDRKRKALRMMESFYSTSRISDLIFLTKRGSITELINCVDYSGYEYVGVTNDDVVYETSGWDEIFVERIKNFGIAYGNDGSNNHRLPAFCVMSSNIPKCLGWIHLPTLNHLCADLVWQYIGEKLNCLYYCPEVKIGHEHYLFGYAKDDVHEKTNSIENYQHDNKKFKEWVRERSGADIMALSEVRRGCRL